MKAHLLVLGSSVAGLLLVARFACTWSGASEPAAPTAGVAAPAGSETVLDPSPTGGSGSELAGAPTDVVARRESERVAVDADDACVLRGRVVGHDGSAGAAARCTIAVRGDDPWRAEGDAPALDDATERRGYAVLADASGAFELVVPEPDALAVELTVAFADGSGTASLAFGAWDCDRPRLRAGALDLGDLEVRRRARVRGTLVDERGLPFGGALVEMVLEKPAWADALQTYYVGSTTLHVDASGTGGAAEPVVLPAATADASGSFELVFEPHPLIGLRASAGDVEVLAPRPLAAELGDELDLGTLVGIRPPTISGRAVDGDGAPVEGVLVRAQPRLESLLSELATSGPDGAFEIVLRSDAPHDLISWAPYGERGTVEVETGRTDVAPGTSDVVLRYEREGVLPRGPYGGPWSLELVVTDRLGEPIEQLSVDQDVNAIPFTVSPPVPAPGGELVVPIDTPWSKFRVLAPGFGAYRGNLDPREWVDGRQRIEITLSRAGSVTGRLVHAGEPMAGEVRASHGRWRLKSSVVADAEGRFLIDGLGAGAWDVEVAVPGFAAQSLEEVQVQPGSATDLGDVEVRALASVRGRVEVGAPFVEAGLAVEVQDARDAVHHAIVDAEGRFALEGLAPGMATARLPGQPPRVMEKVEERIKLRAGEAVEVELDATHLAGATLVVRARTDAGPLAGAIVRVRPRVDGERPQALARTDADGHLRWHVLAHPEAEVLVDAPNGAPLAGGRAEVRLGPGSTAEVDVHVESGELRLALPADVASRSGYSVRVDLTPLDDADGDTIAMRVVRRGEVYNLRGGERWLPGLRVVDGTWDLGPFPPGRFAYTAQVGGSDVVHEGELEVLAGRTATISMSD